MTTSPKTPKAPSLLRKLLRLMQLGVAFGVAGAILNIVLTSEIFSQLEASVAPSPSLAMWVVVRLFLEQLGMILVLPVLAYLAGMFLEGPRALFVVCMVLTVQVSQTLIGVSGEGFDVYLEDLSLVVGYTAIGIALCFVTMGRGQRRLKARAAKTDAPAKPVALKEIDFAAVKQAHVQDPPPAQPAAPASEALVPEAVPATPASLTTPANSTSEQPMVGASAPETKPPEGGAQG